MLRVILTQILLFLLPFFGYALWLWLNKKAHASEHWRNGPMGWLTLAGIGFVLVGLAVFASYKQAPEGAEYRPSQMRDGVFIPGGFEKKDE